MPIVNDRKKSSRSVGKSTGRKAVYPKLQVVACTGRDSLTAEDAKRLLGWEIEGDQPFGEDFLLKDREGHKVRCTYNTANRPYSHTRTLTYMHDILRGAWQFNGHTRIIGKNGVILSGQHVLPALVLAEQTWRLEREKYAHLTKPPTIETLIVKGIEETDAIKNTIDTARESTFADALFRTSHFADLNKGHRKRVAKLGQFAVQILWHRSGAQAVHETPVRTHSDSQEFLNNHPTLVDCVRHVYVENGKTNAIAKLLSCGYTAGLMYLMAASKSDYAKYRFDRREENLNLEQYEQAKKFVTALAQNAGVVRAVRTKIAELIDEGGVVPASLRMAVVCNGWNAWIESGKCTLQNVEIHYTTSDEGARILDELPTLGGVDMVEDELVANENETAPQAAVKGRHTAAQAKKAKRVFKARKHHENRWSLGDRAWVRDDDGDDHYLAQLVSEPFEDEYDTTWVDVLELGSGNPNRYEVNVKHLQLQHP